MEQFGIFIAYRCCVGLLRLHYYRSNIFIQLLCSGVPLCHYYTDNVLCRQDCEAISLYSEFQKVNFNRYRKISLPVRTFDEEKSTAKKSVPTWHELYIEKNSVQPGQNFQNPLPTKLIGSLNPHFCPNWTEVKKPTSTQVVSKSKKLLRNLQRSLTVTSTQVV